MNVIRLGKNQLFISGLYWFSLSNNTKTSISKQKKNLLKLTQTNAFVIDRENAQIGLCYLKHHDKFRAFALLISKYIISKTQQTTFQCAFVLPESVRWVHIVVISGAILPTIDNIGGDFIGSHTEVRRRFELLNRRYEFKENYCPQNWNISPSTPISLKEIIDDQSNNGLTNSLLTVKRIGHINGIGYTIIAAIIAGLGALFFFYKDEPVKNIQNEKLIPMPVLKKSVSSESFIQSCEHALKTHVSVEGENHRFLESMCTEDAFEVTYAISSSFDLQKVNFHDAQLRFSPAKDHLYARYVLHMPNDENLNISQKNSWHQLSNLAKKYRFSLEKVPNQNKTQETQHRNNLSFDWEAKMSLIVSNVLIHKDFNVQLISIKSILENGVLNYIIKGRANEN